VQTCSNCQQQSPDSATHCLNCGADLSEYSIVRQTLKKHTLNPRVKYLLVVVFHDCCPACREVEGSYEKDKAPLLPVEGCSHALGCRCFYQPVLEEIYP
jgi:hypothetical protein